MTILITHFSDELFIYVNITYLHYFINVSSPENVILISCDISQKDSKRYFKTTV